MSDDIDEVHAQIAEQMKTMEIPAPLPPQPIRVEFELPADAAVQHLVIRCGQREVEYMSMDSIRRHLAIQGREIMMRRPRIDLDPILDHIADLQNAEAVAEPEPWSATTEQA